MDGRFQNSIVNVHAHALNLNNQYPTLLEVYTSYSVSNVHDKFHGCTVDVQAATMILIYPISNPVLCVHA